LFYFKINFKVKTKAKEAIEGDSGDKGGSDA
jgi:hypothetical protein